MPSHKAQEKSLRKDKKRKANNVGVKSRMRTLLKKVRAAVESKDKPAAVQAVRQAVSALDTAAKRNLIHPNNASRRKSRLMRLVNAME